MTAAADLNTRVTTVAPYPRDAAIVAGVSTLVMGAAGIFANGTLMALMGGDAAAAAGQGIVIAAIAVAFLLVAVLDIVLAWALWRFFGHEHRDAATLAAWLRVAYAAVLVAGAGDLVRAVRAADGSAPGGAAEVSAALSSFSATWQVGLVVFAVHLGVLALIVVRDRSTPTVIGILLALAALGYAADGIARLLLPADAAILSLLMYAVAVLSVLGEIGLALWLLIRGGRARR